MKIIYFALLLVVMGSCDSTAPANATDNAAPSPLVETNTANPPAPLPVAGYDIVKRYKHDGEAFTQGLL
jgi:glutamine cyclotransferase